MKITAKPADLATALKSLSAFVSKDITRVNLTRIHIEPIQPEANTYAKAPGIRLVATDGHTMGIVDIQGEVDSAGAATPAAIATLTVRVKDRQPYPVAYEIPPDDIHGDFVAYARVLTPKADKADTGATLRAFDGTYLARIGHVQKTIKTEGAVLSFGADSCTPCRADLANTDTGVSAIVIIMPRHL